MRLSRSEGGCDFMRKVEAKWRRAYKSPVARQLNQRFNCLARARSFWALRLKAEARKSATSGSNLREAKVDATWLFLP